MRRRHEHGGAPPRIAAAAIAAALALVAGCDLCETGDLRCAGHVVEECTATRSWEAFHDCGTDTCGVGRDVCQPWLDPGFGEVWCCYVPP
jgi:hypothetical protein